MQLQKTSNTSERRD